MGFGAHCSNLQTFLHGKKKLKSNLILLKLKTLDSWWYLKMSHNAVQLNGATATPVSPVVSYDALPLGGKNGCKLLLTAFSSVQNHTKSRNISQTAGIYNRENEREGK